MFRGYRTYMTTALIVLVQVASFMGGLEADTAMALTSLLLGGGLAFLRAGIANK